MAKLYAMAVKLGISEGFWEFTPRLLFSIFNELDRLVPKEQKRNKHDGTELTNFVLPKDYKEVE